MYFCHTAPEVEEVNGKLLEMTPIFSPAPPSIFRPFDSVITSDSLPPLHQPYFLLTSPPLISHSLQTASECTHTHTGKHVHVRMHPHVSVSPLCICARLQSGAPQRWIKAGGVMVVRRHAGERRSERESENEETVV